jgi:hypothetical protein
MFMARILYTEIKSGERLVATDITDLTFFPKGTILTFSSETYTATSAVFKTIWKICNGQNGTPDLVDKFLRGGAASGTTGGTDSQSVTLTTNHMPSHSHNVNDPGHSHSIDVHNMLVGDGRDWEQWYGVKDGSTGRSTTGISIQNTGGGQPFTVNTVPKYFTVIYIIKVV